MSVYQFVWEVEGGFIWTLQFLNIKEYSHKTHFRAFFQSYHAFQPGKQTDIAKSTVADDI